MYCKTEERGKELKKKQKQKLSTIIDIDQARNRAKL